MAQLARTRAPRSLVATLLGVALLTFLSACGLKAQTVLPYTPAEGVNVNVGDRGAAVQVRNLMILSTANGSGVVSATIIAVKPDVLTGISGYPLKADGSEGAPFIAKGQTPIQLAPGTSIALANKPPITVTSTDLTVGGDAQVTLSFATVGDMTLRVPVVNASQSTYASPAPNPVTMPVQPTPMAPEHGTEGGAGEEGSIDEAPSMKPIHGASAAPAGGHASEAAAHATAAPSAAHS